MLQPQSVFLVTNVVSLNKIRHKHNVVFQLWVHAIDLDKDRPGKRHYFYITKVLAEIHPPRGKKAEIFPKKVSLTKQTPLDFQNCP